MLIVLLKLLNPFEFIRISRIIHKGLWWVLLRFPYYYTVYAWNLLFRVKQLG